MNNKWISAAMALMITFGVSLTTAHADPASDLAAVKKQQSELETKISELDDQIQNLMIVVDKNKKDIAAKQTEINKTKEDIAKQEAAIEAEQNLFNKRLRAMYIGGPTSYIDMILSSKDFGDFISRISNCQTIIEYDTKLIGDFKAKEAQLNASKETLEKDNEKLLALQKDSQAKLAELKKEKAAQAPLLADLKALESKYSAQLASSSTAGLLALAQSTASTSRGSTGVSAAQIIDYASQFLGVPYVWGGTSPSGFDCSGLVQYVYGHFGIYLPRTAAEQQQVGLYVSRDQLQPGDLVFFGDPAHHVGIYVGNGMMLHAPHTGDVVKISPLSTDFTYGRRVL
jgi:cell wall-associated NlpC family hydrolase